VWPCFVARVPMAVAMLPEPMMLIVVMTCVPSVVYGSGLPRVRLPASDGVGSDVAAVHVVEGFDDM